MRQLSLTEAASTASFEREEEEERKRVPAFPFSLEDKLELEHLAQRFLPLRYVTEGPSQLDEAKWEGQQAVPPKAGIQERQLYLKVFLLEAQSLTSTGQQLDTVRQQIHDYWDRIENCWYRRRPNAKRMGIVDQRWDPYWLYSVRQIATYLHLRYWQALRLTKLSDFPWVEAGERQGFRVRPNDLDAWLSNPVRAAKTIDQILAEDYARQFPQKKAKTSSYDWETIQQLIKAGRKQARW